MAGHKSDVKLKSQEKSPLAEYNVVLNHHLDFDDVSILAHVENVYKRLFVKMCFIKQHDTMNRQMDLEKVRRDRIPTILT